MTDLWSVEAIGGRFTPTKIPDKSVENYRTSHMMVMFVNKIDTIFKRIRMSRAAGIDL